MEYFSSDDMLFKLAYMTANTTTDVIYSLQQTAVTLSQNQVWPEWSQPPDISYYRLIVDEDSSYSSQQSIVQLFVEQGGEQIVVYQVDTLWNMLAILGGVFVAVLALRWLCMHQYEEYRQEKALLEELYSSEEGKLRKPFEVYGFGAYLKSKLCGCGEATNEHRRFLKAQRMLDEELDVLLIVKQMRLVRALSKA